MAGLVSAAAAGLRRLEPGSAFFLLCDIQEVFRDKIYCMEHVIYVSPAPLAKNPAAAAAATHCRCASEIVLTEWSCIA